MACKFTFNGKELSELEFKEELLNRFKDKPIDLNEVIKEFGGEQPSKETGISARAREKRAGDLKTKPEEAGAGWTGEDALERGKQLIKDGANADDIIAEYNKTGKVSGNDIAVLQARAVELAHETNKAGDEFGTDSQEYKDALQKELDFSKASKPLSTESHLAFAAHQGAVDIDTGTWTGLERAFREEHGKEPTAEQKKEAEQLANEVKAKDDKIADLEKKLYELHEKEASAPTKTYTKKAKEVADQFRKLKTKPITFKDANGNEIKITKLSVVDWNELVELGAKAIEKTGEIADGIKAIVDELKDHDWYASLSEDDKKAVNSQIEDLFKIGKDNIAEMFVDKKGNDFSPEEVKQIWKYSKDNYIDKGVNDFDKITSGVADDLGLTQEQVKIAFSMPKGARKITDEMYRAQSRRRDAINNAKVWVKSAGEPKLTKALKMLPSFWFRKAVFGHGTVGMITHGGMNIFRPSDWKTYFPNFIRQFQFMSRVQHEKFMQNFEKEPDYTFWKRAGLNIDPHKSYDEYTSHSLKKASEIPVIKQMKKLFDESSKMGDRGFDALKVYRYDQAKTIWDGLKDYEKTPETAKAISDMVNAATGTVSTQFHPLINSSFFAPRLEASRWKRLIGTPAKTLVTLTKVLEGTATTEEKVAAKLVAKRTGETLATLAAMLAANQAMLYLTNSKDKINYTDPTKSDFLRFKAGGKKIDVSGGILPTTSLIGTLAETVVGEAKKSRGKDVPRAESLYKTLGQQVRGKLSPFSGTLADFITHRDFMGNVMPFSSDKPDRYHKKLTWGDYIKQTQLPIPVAAMFKDIQEGAKEHGMKTDEAKNILSGALTGAIMGITGAHVGNVPKEKKK